jgi:hypothetical protein
VVFQLFKEGDRVTGSAEVSLQFELRGAVFQLADEVVLVLGVASTKSLGDKLAVLFHSAEGVGVLFQLVEGVGALFQLAEGVGVLFQLVEGKDGALGALLLFQLFGAGGAVVFEFVVVLFQPFGDDGVEALFQLFKGGFGEVTEPLLLGEAVVLFQPLEDGGMVVLLFVEGVVLFQLFGTEGVVAVLFQLFGAEVVLVLLFQLLRVGGEVVLAFQLLGEGGVVVLFQLFEEAEEEEEGVFGEVVLLVE